MTIIKLLARTVGFLLSLFNLPKCIEYVDAFWAHVYTSSVRRRFGYLDASALLAGHGTLLIGERYIRIGAGTQIGRNASLFAWDSYAGNSYSPSITIGENCLLRDGLQVSAIGSVQIGQGVLTGINVLIADNSHGRFCSEHLLMNPKDRPVESKGGVRIGDRVWLGNNVCVLPGVTIGEGSIIGANSVVTHDIPPYSLAVGSPAKVVRQLTRE